MPLPPNLFYFEDRDLCIDYRENGVVPKGHFFSSILTQSYSITSILIKGKKSSTDLINPTIWDHQDIRIQKWKQKLKIHSLFGDVKSCRGPETAAVDAARKAI